MDLYGAQKMRVVILAGGMGTRLRKETSVRPKPMVEIGGKPILWHIVKRFAHYQRDDFFVALSSMGDFIKDYFLHRPNLARTGWIQRADQDMDRWKVNLLETGLRT